VIKKKNKILDIVTLHILNNIYV